MTYQEKLKLAEEVAVELKNATAVEIIKEQLASKGLYTTDIDKILFSAKNILEEEFGAKIKEYMLAGNLEQKISEFESLDVNVFESIKERTKSIIVEDASKKVKQLASEGMSDAQIITATISPYFSEHEVKMQIENFRQYTETPKGAEKNWFLITGSVCFVTGLILFGYKIMYGGRIGLASVLLGYGVYNLYKAFTPKGVIDAYSKKN